MKSNHEFQFHGTGRGREGGIDGINFGQVIGDVIRKEREGSERRLLDERFISENSIDTFDTSVNELIKHQVNEYLCKCIQKTLSK